MRHRCGTGAAAGWAHLRKLLLIQPQLHSPAVLVAVLRERLARIRINPRAHPPHEGVRQVQGRRVPAVVAHQQRAAVLSVLEDPGASRWVRAVHVKAAGGGRPTAVLSGVRGGRGAGPGSRVDAEAFG